MGALALGAVFIGYAVALLRSVATAPMATFRYSIVYLLLLFVALLVDHYLLDALPGALPGAPRL